jgi:hypothetical protein
MAIGYTSACAFDFRIPRIFEASTKGHSINYIIAPSTIYGVGTENPVHKLSQQIPGLVRLAIQRRQTVYGGKGMFGMANCSISSLSIARGGGAVRCENGKQRAAQRLDDVHVLMTHPLPFPLMLCTSCAALWTPYISVFKRQIVDFGIYRNKSVEQRAYP